MFFKHSKDGLPCCSPSANGIVSRFPESPVNPQYKPRTLAELKALFDHTGINPSPVALREPIKEVDGIDAMDIPPVPIGGDTFEVIRSGQALENELRNSVDDYRARSKKTVESSPKSSVSPDVSDRPAE